jgi:hypothetical protein
MAKTQETLELEESLYRATRNMSVFGCFEVTIGFWKDRMFGKDQRVDFMTMDTEGTFRAYEIKVTKADFHSKCANSFVGHFNYYVMPIALYEQVKDEIPSHIGVWCGSVIKKPKRVELSFPADVLMRSMVRSLSRDADKYLMAVYENETIDTKLAKERKKNKETIGELRRERQRLQHTISFFKGDRIKDLGEKSHQIEYWRKDYWKLMDENRSLRAEMEKTR